MYPSQTSLIPASIALIRFFEEKGFLAFGQNYPYWYLGTTPYKFLIGPVIPILVHSLRLISGLKPESSALFSITIYLIFFSFLLSAFGWMVLMYQVSETKYQGRKTILFSAFFLLLFLIFPWKYMAGLAIDEASVTIARSLLPWVFLTLWRFLQRKNLSNSIIVIISISFLLLVNTNILPILLVGLISLTIAFSFENGKIKYFLKNFKPTLMLIIASLLLVTFYYSPKYWLTILFNPSIGGITALKAITRVIGLFRNLIPLVLAIAVVYFAKKIKSKISLFSLLWIFTFLFLTIYRFLADPDFWMDWTSWFGEIEIGLLLLVFTQRKISKYLLISILPFFFSYFIWNKLNQPKLVSRTKPIGIQSLDKLSTISKYDYVFLSGSTVFWVDAFYNIKQIRGGKDEVALDSNWYKASWELREGSDIKETKDWLDSLKIKYVLLHKENSPEYYHDFKNLSKWEKMGTKIWENRGDIIYSF